MLMPKRTRHRKVHRGRRKGPAKGGTKVNFGDYGLQALSAGWITARQIESARVAITRSVRRGAGCGSPSSPTSRSPPNRLRPAWAPEKATPNSGWRW